MRAHHGRGPEPLLGEEVPDLVAREEVAVAAPARVARDAELGLTAGAALELGEAARQVDAGCDLAQRVAERRALGGRRERRTARRDRDRELGARLAAHLC